MILRSVAVATVWPLSAVLLAAIGMLLADDPTSLRRMKNVTNTWSGALLAVPPIVALASLLAARVKRTAFTVGVHAAGALTALFLQDAIVRTTGVALGLFRAPPPGQMTIRAVNLPYMVGIYVVVVVTAQLLREIRRLREEEQRWRTESGELAARTRRSVWQAVQPRFIRDVLLAIADRCTTAPREAEVQTMQLARFVRFVLRSGAAEWTPALEQVRRVKTMWRAHGGAGCFEVTLAGEHRHLLVPAAVSAVAARLLDQLREPESGLRLLIAQGSATLTATGASGVALDELLLPAGVTTEIREQRGAVEIVLAWPLEAVRQTAPPAARGREESRRQGRIRSVVAFSYLLPAVVVASLDLLSSILYRLTGGKNTLLGFRALMIAIAAVLLLFVLDRWSLAKPRRFFAAALLGAVAAGAILQLAPTAAWLLSLRERPFDRFSLFATYMDLMLCFVIAGGAVALRFRRAAEWYRAQRRHGVDPALSHDAIALETQLQPHFFFNTLNAVAGLLAVDPAAAARVARSLARLIESVASDTGVYEVQLASEMQTVEQYVAIERIRFGDRLQFRATGDAPHRDLPFPRLLLLVLVQNAVKHGVAHMRSECNVLVTIHRRLGALSVRVANDAVPQANETRRDAGRGNRQVVSRMVLLYGRQGGVRFTREPRRYLAELTVPVR
ncbi:MAG TPA: histidine kinase [Thermoanaerobaculia bacterium]